MHKHMFQLVRNHPLQLSQAHSSSSTCTSRAAWGDSPSSDRDLARDGPLKTWRGKEAARWNLTASSSSNEPTQSHTSCTPTCSRLDKTPHYCTLTCSAQLSSMHLCNLCIPTSSICTWLIMHAAARGATFTLYRTSMCKASTCAADKRDQHSIPPAMEVLKPGSLHRCYRSLLGSAHC